MESKVEGSQCLYPILLHLSSGGSAQRVTKAFPPDILMCRDSGMSRSCPPHLTAGTNPIKAVYGGDSNFLGSTSKTVSQVVSKTRPRPLWLPHRIRRTLGSL
jgi:hypothetical protein